MSPDGDYENDGKSWAKAKDNLQNAIDEVYGEIKGTSKVAYIYVEGYDSQNEADAVLLGMYASP